MSDAITFRGKLLSAGGCSFTAQILADYGDTVHSFTVDCEGDAEGNLSLRVTAPETIAGIEAKLSEDGGEITYEGLALGFGLLAGEQISPAAAPGLALGCWCREFILSAGREAERYRASYEKKISNKVLLIDTYFENGIPISAELCYNDSRIISMQISQFRFR